MTITPAWRRCALGGGGGMFVAMGLGRFSYGAMVPALIARGDLSPLEAGRVGTINLVGFLIGAVLSVPLARWLGRRMVLQAALVAAIAGLAASAVPWGFEWLATARGVIGIATALIMVLSLALIADTAPADRRPEAAGYVFAGVGLGISSSGILVPMLLTQGLTAAWLGVLAAGVVAGMVAVWGWRAGPRETPLPISSPGARKAPLGGRALYGLMIAHGLFSLGIVPHTIYWVDFLVRARNLGVVAGGLHWTIVGIAAALGPLVTALLARRIGTAAALIVGFLVLAIGIGLPAIAVVAPALFLSSIIFGAQPGLSSLMAARARDLGTPSEMPRVMRAMILANAMGGMAGGLIVPWILAGGAGVAAGHAPLFVLGAAAMTVAAVAAWSRERPAA